MTTVLESVGVDKITERDGKGEHLKISSLLGTLLANAGFDTPPERLGITEPATFKPSDLVARITYIAVMLLAAVEAANRLGFTQIADLASVFAKFGGQVLLGTAILVIGFLIANLAAATVRKVSGDKAGFLAGLTRIAILGLVLAMGLKSMGLADDIVNMAFGLILGAVAIAVALSFGLGGREAEGNLMDYWLSKLRRE